MNGKVQLVECENLVNEYIKLMPVPIPRPPLRKDRKAAKVKEYMSRNPVSVKPEEGIQDAMSKMGRGHSSKRCIFFPCLENSRGFFAFVKN